MRCHLAGFLYDLYTASTGTDNPHPLAAKLNPLLGPVARMVALPLELPDVLKIGCIGLCCKTCAKDKVARLYAIFMIRFYIPLIAICVKLSCSNTGIKPDVFFEIQPRFEVFEIIAKFVPGGIFFRPVPE